MQWTSEAIILKQEQFSDDKLLCWLFSATYGLYKGLITLNKKTRGQIQVGNIVHATWRARLPEQLGSYYCELIKPLPMAIIGDKLKLSSMASLCALLSSCLPDRVLEAKLYAHTISYILTLKDHNNWLIEYLKLELLLLQEMGYGLVLDVCALTGARDNLYYISPKTGSAVTKEAGIAYHNKLLKLPGFFLGNSVVDKKDIEDGFKLTGHFIHKFLFHGKSLPQQRARFIECVL
jgi:DNA repair protein RecO (recombination protein O)